VTFKEVDCAMLLKGRKELCFLSVAWCSPTEPIPSDSRHCHTQPTSHGERRLQQSKRKVSLTEIVSEMREICQADDQLIPPIIIVDLWPISVPSSTPRQTFPFSCKSPIENMIDEPGRGNGVKDVTCCACELTLMIK
jgi:hypothetical protein